MATTRSEAASLPTPPVAPVIAWTGLVLLVVAHLAGLALVGDGSGLWMLVVVESGLFVIVAAVETGMGRFSLRSVVVQAGCWVGFVGGTLVVASEMGVVGVALALSGVIGLVLYGLHRYELVALGLVEVADERE